MFSKCQQIIRLGSEPTILKESICICFVCELNDSSTKSTKEFPFNTFRVLLLSSRVWRRRWWQPTPVLLPGKSHGRRSLVGCSPWGHKESDTTERPHFHFSLSCTREGNGNPLRCSCLENPRDGEPGGLPSLGSHRVGHDWSDLAVAAECENWWIF